MKELHAALLELHRVIIAVEREDYERRAGAVNPAEFLRLLAADEGWSWLRPLSGLITADVTDITATRKLLSPDSAGNPFQQRYAWLMERSPDVVYVHGAVMKALKEARA